MFRRADSAAAVAVIAAVAAASIGCELIAGITDRQVATGGGGQATNSSSNTGGAGGSATSGIGPASSSSGTGGASGVTTSSGAGAGGAGGGGPLAAWPDSHTVYCSDGVAVEACPPSSDALYGQDGNYREHQPSYDTSVSGIAVDSVTHLMWDRQVIKNHNAGGLDLACGGLSDGGFHDWRTPEMIELLSLVDFGRTLPAIDHATFPNAERFLWSNEIDVEDDTLQWGIDFTTGHASPEPRTQAEALMCVRNSLPAAGLVQAGTEMFADPRTGLTWETHTSMDSYISWADALFHCENLSFGGHDDWRLPSAKELLTLMRRDSATFPYIDAAIQDQTTLDPYWTSSPTVGDPSGGHIIVFYTGYDTQGGSANMYNVRCVRDSDGP